MTETERQRLLTTNSKLRRDLQASVDASKVIVLKHTVYTEVLRLVLRRYESCFAEMARAMLVCLEYETAWWERGHNQPIDWWAARVWKEGREPRILREAA